MDNNKKNLDILLTLQQKEISCKCKFWIRILDKTEKAWQICLECYKKERVYK